MAAEIRDVRLELLRAGPPHNQLLSPLTDYLGLCGDQGATVVNVPWEHRQFMRRLERLRYPGRQPSTADHARRQGQLEELAGEIAAILGEIPGLALSATESLTHLQIVHSAAELALLPFELSKTPKGFPGGSREWLALQTAAPVCVTRTMRSVSSQRVCWPQEPRILFVAASPRGMTVPLEPHTRALLGAIQPWLKRYDPRRPADLQSSVERILTVLPRASIAAIEDAYARHAFTHVHVLAHGVPHPAEEGNPYGVALHTRAGKDEVEVVTGQRFVTALRHVGKDERVSLPCVVTLATCDSGNVGDVVFSGASFAHELHQGGVPLVVASQYPLSFAGSVLMAETIYSRLLWGEDPRRVLVDLRRKLYALHSATTHDWASLVAYAALPEDLPTQLEATRYRQARRGIDARLDWIDKEIDAADPDAPPSFRRIKQLFASVDQAADRLPTGGSYLTEITGLRGSGHKRKAQVLFEYAAGLDSGSQEGGAADNAAVERRQAMDLMWQELLRSRRRYREAARYELAPAGETELLFPTLLHWVLTQYLSLNAILGRKFLEHHWHAALLSARAQLVDGGEEDRLWAHGSLAELYLLTLAYPEGEAPMSAERAMKVMREHGEEFRDLAPPAIPGQFSPTYSTVRQFRRYTDWWGHPLFESHLREAKVERQPWDQVGQAVKLFVEVLEDV